jgi:hypothetical protein
MIFNQFVEVHRYVLAPRIHANNSTAKRDKGAVQQMPYLNSVTVKKGKNVYYFHVALREVRQAHAQPAVRVLPLQGRLLPGLRNRDTAVQGVLGRSVKVQDARSEPDKGLHPRKRQLAGQNRAIRNFSAIRRFRS